jgi:hypothetical protein
MAASTSRALLCSAGDRMMPAGPCSSSEHGLLAAGRLAGAAEQGDVTRGRERFVHAGGKFGEEGVGQIVQHQRDAAGGAPTQISRGAVVHIALQAQFLFDPRAGFAVDQRAAAQHQRYRGARQVAAGGNIVERDLAMGRRMAGHGNVRKASMRIWNDPKVAYRRS